MPFWNTIQTRRVEVAFPIVRNMTPMSHVIIVKSPGFNKAIQVVSASFKLMAGNNPYNFTDDMCLKTGIHPQFTLDVGVINSSFNEWTCMVPTSRLGSLKVDSPLMFGPLAGANTSFEANGDIILDVAYRVLKA